ncbi:hypothetical protein NDU88_005730 [Pleurodeles waltl]|uniref:Uncharacterized protein n=1 Tax=Pleurodeles waltl TaxID=8319 RepID=A0AAV7RN14_PLEWA|nr:hypothetical protein NDU88_005730 [Pleurodeles waltl]
MEAKVRGSAEVLAARHPRYMTPRKGAGISGKGIGRGLAPVRRGSGMVPDPKMAADTKTCRDKMERH